LVSRGMFYGISVTFVALILVSSTLALVYFNDYQQEASQNQVYVSELGSALASYRSLAASYNSSIGDYNRTLSLLVVALANLNTSLPAYRNASMALSSLWTSYQRLADFGGRKALVYEVRMLVDYGNGTRTWYNDTSIQPGWNGYVVTLVLLDGQVEGSWYPSGYFGQGVPGEHFVTGIDGVSQTPSMSWFVWQFDGRKWNLFPSGADELQVVNGTSFAWTLCSYDANFNPACSP
jgi:hypothetical protein